MHINILITLSVVYGTLLYYCLVSTLRPIVSYYMIGSIPRSNYKLILTYIPDRMRSKCIVNVSYLFDNTCSHTASYGIMRCSADFNLPVERPAYNHTVCTWLSFYLICATSLHHVVKFASMAMPQPVLKQSLQHTLSAYRLISEHLPYTFVDNELCAGYCWRKLNETIW